MVVLKISSSRLILCVSSHNREHTDLIIQLQHFDIICLYKCVWLLLFICVCVAFGFVCVCVFSQVVLKRHCLHPLCFCVCLCV